MLTAATSAAPATRARGLQSWSLALRPAGCIVHPNPPAARAAQESLSLFEAVDDPVRGALSRLLIAVEGVAGGDVAGYLDMVELSRTDLGEHQNAWGLALADFVEMEIRLYHDSPTTALALGHQAAAQFDALDDNWGRSAVRLHLGIGLRLAGQTAEAAQVLHEAVLLSQETGLPNNLARSLAELGELALHKGDADEAEQWLERCQEIVTYLADDTLQALVFTCQADVARYQARPSPACDLYQRAFELYRRNNVLRGRARALTGIAAAHLDMSDINKAQDALDEAARLAKESDDPAIYATSLEQLARLSVAGSASDQAPRLLCEAELIRTESRRPRSALAERDVAATARANSCSPTT
jgi:tetratricopeptide (TPR) repeat protein